MDWRRWSPSRFSKSRRRSNVDPVRVPEVEAKSNSKFEPNSESRSSAQKNGRPGRIRRRFWMFYIWLEAKFHRASNGTGLMPKFVLSQWKSSKQIDVQNLPRCCIASLMGLRPKLGAPHPWSPPTLGCPFSYLLSSRRLRNLSFIYLLALATTEQPPLCRRRVIQTPPSSDIKIARLRFLFVL
jgi:hypothetical protein